MVLIITKNNFADNYTFLLQQIKLNAQLPLYIALYLNVIVFIYAYLFA